jgi:hypothetical protein
MTTAAREPEMGLTFEKVWAMFQESDRRMRKLSEETDQKIQEIAQQMRETDRKMQEMNKVTNWQVGKWGYRFEKSDEFDEYSITPSIVEKFNARGLYFDEIAWRYRIFKSESSGQIIAAFDILLGNGESIVGVEVKSKPSSGDVKDYVRRLKILRLNKNKKGDKRKIYGAFTGAIMPDTVKTAALKAGLYVITQTGDTVKIDVPEGFIPKTW